MLRKLFDICFQTFFQVDIFWISETYRLLTTRNGISPKNEIKPKSKIIWSEIFEKKNNLSNIMSFDNNLTLILDKRNFSIKDDIGNASNTTSNNDADDPNFGQHNITAIVVLTLIYGLLSLTACVGNLLVIWIIGKYLFVYFCSLYFLRLNYLKSFERKIYFVLQLYCWHFP